MTLELQPNIEETSCLPSSIKHYASLSLGSDIVKETHIRVKIFGAPSLALESRELTVHLDQDATAQNLLDTLPIKDRDYVYVVREGIRLTSSSKLHDGDEIMIIPPIAGGS